MSFTGGVFPIEIFFRIAFFLSSKELRSWLCVQPCIVSYFRNHDGYSRYAQSIFFFRFRDGLRLCNAEVEKSKARRLVNSVLNYFGRDTKTMLLNDKGIRRLYAKTNTLLTLSENVAGK
ncbi:unnamed protein product, partial [marine sediment metagenome]